MTTILPAPGQALAGKVAVITGAGRGIGQAIALGYARAGAAVVCSARSSQEIEAVAAQIVGEGSQASACAADVCDVAAVQALFQHAAERFGGVDIVVVNAGEAGQARKVEKSDPAQWAHVIQVNLVGAFNTAHAAIPHLRARGAGKIILMGSAIKNGTAPGLSAYAASKAGLWKLTQVLGMELAADHISVNELIPGPVKTAMTKFGDMAMPPGEWIKEPEEVLPLALFLATQLEPGPTAQSFSLNRRAT